MPILALQQTQALEFHSLSEWFFHITLFLLYLFFPMFLPLIAQCLASLLSGRDGGSKNRRSFCRCHWVGGRRYKVKSRKCTHRIRSLKRSFFRILWFFFGLWAWIQVLQFRPFEDVHSTNALCQVDRVPTLYSCSGTLLKWSSVAIKGWFPSRKWMNNKLIHAKYGNMKGKCTAKGKPGKNLAY